MNNVPMIRTTLFVAFSLLAFAGCKKKETTATDKPAAGDKMAPSADKPAADKPAEGGDKPKEMAAPELWTDFNAPGQDGMALMEKWKAGVIVNGTVKNVIGDKTVWLDGGGTHNVSLDFTDAGAAVKAKAVKAGDKLAAQCKMGGSDGNNLMMLTDCVLK